jgi:hypothetical protein
MIELADELEGSLEGVEVAIAMIADVHPAPPDRARAVQDIEFPTGELRLSRPVIRHPTRLHVLVKDFVRRTRTRGYAEKTGFSSPLSAH